MFNYKRQLPPQLFWACGVLLLLCHLLKWVDIPPQPAFKIVQILAQNSHTSKFITRQLLPNTENITMLEKTLLFRCPCSPYDNNWRQPLKKRIATIMLPQICYSSNVCNNAFSENFFSKKIMYYICVSLAKESLLYKVLCGLYEIYTCTYGCPFHWPVACRYSRDQDNVQTLFQKCL